MSSPIPVYTAGSHHHTLWMAKTMYTIKTALFTNQLKEFFKPQMLDFIQNLNTFLTLFYVKFWLCSTDATNATQLDLDLLKHLEEAKTKVGDPETIKMVETAYLKLKDRLWYLSERLVPLALLSARVVDRDKKEKANAILKYQNQARTDCQQMLEKGDFGAKLFKDFVGPDSWTFFKLLHEKEPAFLPKRV